MQYTFVSTEWFESHLTLDVKRTTGRTYDISSDLWNSMCKCSGKN